MNQASMGLQDKLRLKEALISHAGDAVTAVQQSVSEEDSAAVLDQTSSYSLDDQSQSDEAGAMASIFAESVAAAQDQLATIEALDMAPRDRVEPGAVVGFGGQRYVVGVVTDAVSCDGVDYEGISTESAMYAAIQGRQLGDAFDFRGQHLSIEFLA